MSRHFFTPILIGMIGVSLFMFGCIDDDDDDLIKENGITGRVTDADTNEPIAGALVQIAGIDTGSVATDSDGRFFFEDVSDGAYEVTVSAVDYDDYKGTVTVNDGIANADVVLKKPVPPALSGAVTDFVTGQPIVNATITTFPVTNSAFTDATGQYRFDKLEPGNYTVTAIADGYGSNSVTVVVVDEQTARADIQLTAGGPILDCEPTSIDFGINATSKLLAIDNAGDGILNWNIAAPSDKWIAVEPRQGNVADIASIVNVTVDRAELDAGLYNTTLVVTSNGGIAQISVIMKVE